MLPIQPDNQEGESQNLEMKIILYAKTCKKQVLKLCTNKWKIYLELEKDYFEMKIKSYSKACKDSGSETQSTNKWKFVEELEKDLTLKSCLDKLENKRKNSYVHIKRMKSKTSLNSYSDMINKSQRPYRDGM